MTGVQTCALPIYLNLITQIRENQGRKQNTGIVTNKGQDTVGKQNSKDVQIEAGSRDMDFMAKAEPVELTEDCFYPTMVAHQASFPEGMRDLVSATFRNKVNRS